MSWRFMNHLQKDLEAGFGEKDVQISITYPGCSGEMRGQNIHRLVIAALFFVGVINVMV